MFWGHQESGKQGCPHKKRGVERLCGRQCTGMQKTGMWGSSSNQRIRCKRGSGQQGGVEPSKSKKYRWAIASGWSRGGGGARVYKPAAGTGGGRRLGWAGQRGTNGVRCGSAVHAAPSSRQRVAASLPARLLLLLILLLLPALWPVCGQPLILELLL